MRQGTACLPPPLWGPNLKTLTGHVVRHLPGVVQQTELPAVQGFPGPLISQLVPEGDEERKLWVVHLNCSSTGTSHL